MNRNATKKILVLGDSFATSLGCFSNNFLDHLISKHQFTEEVIFYNPSVFNLTSADSYFLAQKYLSCQHYDAVVIALGNCDACAFGYYKKVRKTFSAKRNFCLNKKYDKKIKAKNSLLKRNPPYTFKFSNKNELLRNGAVSAKEFGENISSIIKLCSSNETPVLLININANKYYPPCNNTSNYCFARIFGLETSLPYSGMGECTELNEALRLHEREKYAEAEIAYKRLIDSNMDTELSLICRNNLGAISFVLQDYIGAEQRLAEITDTDNQLYPIVIYNLAILAQVNKQYAKAEELFNKAYEMDYGSYRIHTAYREEVCNKISSENIIDGNTYIVSSDYVDYCHPKSSGHAKYADVVNEKLSSLINLQNGEISAKVQYLPANPDYSVGFETDFFTHFNLSVIPDASFGHELLKDNVNYKNCLKNADNLTSDLKISSKNAIKAHPLFGCKSLLEEIHPLYKSDQGRIPEYFFIRLMLPAYKSLQGKVAAIADFAELKEYIADYSKIQQWWNELKLPSIGDPAEHARRIAGAVDWTDVIERMNALVDFSLEHGVNYENRVRSITNWFMREALIFGAVSNCNMYYRRKDFWYIADSCLFYRFFAQHTSAWDREVNNIIKRTCRILQIHNKYCAALRITAPDMNLRKNYENDLMKLK